jgi:hypothetical protein
MEKERMEKMFEIQPILQIKENINANEGEEIMKENFKILHLHKIKWRHDSINGNKPMDVKWFSLMRCIICCANSILIQVPKHKQGKV